jgi:hypothetical protein
MPGFILSGLLLALSLQFNNDIIRSSYGSIDQLRDPFIYQFDKTWTSLHALKSNSVDNLQNDDGCNTSNNHFAFCNLDAAAEVEILLEFKVNDRTMHCNKLKDCMGILKEETRDGLYYLNLLKTCLFLSQPSHVLVVDHMAQQLHVINGESLSVRSDGTNKTGTESSSSSSNSRSGTANILNLVLHKLSGQLLLSSKPLPRKSAYPPVAPHISCTNTGVENTKTVDAKILLDDDSGLAASCTNYTPTDLLGRCVLQSLLFGKFNQSGDISDESEMVVVQRQFQVRPNQVISFPLGLFRYPRENVSLDTATADKTAVAKVLGAVQYKSKEVPIFMACGALQDAVRSFVSGFTATSDVTHLHSEFSIPYWFDLCNISAPIAYLQQVNNADVYGTKEHDMTSYSSVRSVTGMPPTSDRSKINGHSSWHVAGLEDPVMPVCVEDIFIALQERSTPQHKGKVSFFSALNFHWGLSMYSSGIGQTGASQYYSPSSSFVSPLPAKASGDSSRFSHIGKSSSSGFADRIQRQELAFDELVSVLRAFPHVLDDAIDSDGKHGNRPLELSIQSIGTHSAIVAAAHTAYTKEVEKCLRFRMVNSGTEI